MSIGVAIYRRHCKSAAYEQLTGSFGSQLTCPTYVEMATRC